MTLAIFGIFTILNIFHAKYDSWRISKGLSINHILNGLGYLVCVGISCLLSKSILIVIPILFNRLVFFNISLSLFRKLKWDYISPSPKSIIDKIGKWIFKNNGKVMYIVYILLFIISMILYENNL